jgi:hypothetical protein
LSLLLGQCTQVLKKDKMKFNPQYVAIMDAHKQPLELKKLISKIILAQLLKSCLGKSHEGSNQGTAYHPLTRAELVSLRLGTCF